MSQKSNQKSRDKPQPEDYAFQPSPQPKLFEHYAQFGGDEPALGPVLRHPSPSERRHKHLDKESELLKKEKEKLALEMEVLCVTAKLSDLQCHQLHRQHHVRLESLTQRKTSSTGHTLAK